MTSPGAKVSGPGAFSQRTDTGGQPIRALPDPKYGEATAFEEQQKAAPLANSAESAVPNATPAPSRMPVAPGPGNMPAQALPGIFDMGDPSIPVTSGAPSGAGPNDISGLPPGLGGDFNPVAFHEALAPYAAADQTGVLGDIIAQLSERGLW